MRRFLIVALLLGSSASADAQQPIQRLTSCVADNTTGKDRKELAKWIFLAMSAHPEMKAVASINSATAMDDSSRTVAALMTSLLTQMCSAETRAVVNTGQAAEAMGLAFQNLGQLAMQELMADKSVQDSMALFQQYIDQKRLAETFAGK